MAHDPASDNVHDDPSGVDRLLLAGTSESLLTLCRAMADANASSSIIGLVTVGSGGSGVPVEASVLGPLSDLGKIIRSECPDTVVISLPTAMEQAARAAVQQCEQTGVPWRWVATIEDQLAGKALGSNAIRRGKPAVSSTRLAPQVAVDALALLGRSPRELDELSISRIVRGNVVMITGAGGSIGSELARIVCRFEPSKLCLIERSENALFEIDRQIGTRWPRLARLSALHDVTDAAKTRSLLRRERPDIILHAAAHKHVPMMEDHPAEAIENNYLGTRSIADAAVACGVKRFVMISTDKAVNPSSVMGATKRLAELYVQSLNRTSETRFAMVRFGNVLGSACSVLPIWSRQIAEGLPVTVTDERMTRYFMTIPEAAGLVLQSMALAGRVEAAPHGGELFLLDMGEPVSIHELARQFIRAHGLEPDVDVPVAITGVRPGEKLHEELVYATEHLIPTPHEAIRVLDAGEPDEGVLRLAAAALDSLRNDVGAYPWDGADRQALLDAVRIAVPEMLPQPARRMAS